MNATIETTMMLDHALAYARHGWAVLPCVPKGKHPLTPNGFKDATIDPEQIAAWWTETPDANIGLACGAKSGVTAVDIDIKPWAGKHGDETLRALTEEHGALPPTLVQQTWSGGRQYFFQRVERVKSSAGTFGKDLDCRNDGGYVIVPPSTVREGDREGTYVWLEDPYVTPLAEMPEWLVAVGTNDKPLKERKGKEAAADLKIGVNRSKSLLSMAGSMVRRGFNEGAIEAALVAQNAASADPLPEERVDALVRDTAGWERVVDEWRDDRHADEDHAESLAKCARDSLRYCTDSQEWFVFDGRRWIRAASWEKVAPYVRQLRQQFYLAAGAKHDRGKADRYAEQGLRLGNYHTIRNVIRLAQAQPSLQIEAGAFDTDPDLLNVANGTLDLQMFELRPHAREDMLTVVLDVPYEKDAACPRWRAFLDEVFLGNQSVIDFVQRAVGYTLTGRIDEQVLFLLHGGGQNGKSTFVEVLNELLGPYSTKVDQETVLAADKNRGRGATPELMVLVGKRLAYIDELEEDRQLDEARIKALTGSAKGTGRQLYSGMDQWRNTAKLWFDLNHLPGYRGIDEGIARRPKVIPFDWRVPDEQKDGALPQKLREELPGILAWAVEGCRQWREQGLNPPEAVSLATRAYTEANNHLPAFARETYVKSPAGRVPVADMKTDYAGWCASRGEQPMDYAKKVAKFFETVWGLKRTKAHGSMVWTGIASKKDQDRVDAIVAGVLAHAPAGGDNGQEQPPHL